jgi:glycosyltransferase involved in cell wall biosynthesis
MTIIYPPAFCIRPKITSSAIGVHSDYELLDKPLPIADQSWPAGTRPLVSVLCITYNHENYIKQAIEGFLIQETTFPVQIVIHDDASTDSTAAVIRHYEELHPRLILAVLRSDNLYSQGIAIEINHLVLGDFVAFCEGDDFWSSPLKIYQQIQAFSQFSDASICTHRVLLDTGMQVSDPFDNKLRDFTKEQSATYTRISAATLLNHRSNSRTCSIMVTRPVYDLFSEFLAQMPPFAVRDIYLLLSAVSLGACVYIDSQMAVYRQGCPGSWSRKMKSSSTFQFCQARERILGLSYWGLFRSSAAPEVKIEIRRIRRWIVFSKFSILQKFQLLVLSICPRSWLVKT